MKALLIMVALLAVLLIGIQQAASMDKTDDSMMDKPMSDGYQTAVFAGGCFWCTESDFEHVDGVIEAISGYTGGHVPNPTYKQVSNGGTGHVESVKVIFDPKKISYPDLLEVFWRKVNPTDAGGQFVDRGSQYRSVIFYADEHQHQSAEASKKELAASGIFNKPIATEILPLGPFYPAETYHQDYYKKNPIRYHWYRSHSGRDQFTEKIWADRPMKPKDKMKMNATESKPIQDEKQTSAMGDAGARSMESAMPQKKEYPIPDDAQLRRQLTPLQYKVVRKSGTEPPFNNTYWNNHQDGIYVDIVSGEPLFSSKDKFDSGTGWPSFTRPLEAENVVEKSDRSFFRVRTEVRSKHADSHLGHVFDDGPRPTGLRYCINSAALRFVPKADLKKEGYSRYLSLFDADAATITQGIKE